MRSITVTKGTHTLDSLFNVSQQTNPINIHRYSISSIASANQQGTDYKIDMYTIHDVGKRAVFTLM